MSCMVCGENFIIVSKGDIVDYYDYNKHHFLDYDKGSNESVLDIAVSPNNKYLALITAATKRLLIYEISSLICIRKFTLPRSASKIRFAINNTQIFVADKTGDVLLYDISTEESGKKILGHLSLLLNVLQTNDGNYIITSDRDEKIRVSHFPNTYNIQTYCLGHKEFVNHLELLPHDDKFLVTTSGDGTVKCWDYLTGQLFYTFDTNIDVDNEHLSNNFRKMMDEVGIEVNNLPIVNFSITCLRESCSLIVVSLHLYKKLLLYSLHTINNKLVHKLEKVISIEFFPAVCKFHELSLFVYNDLNLTISKYDIVNVPNEIEVNLRENLLFFENQNIKEENDIDLNSIKVMFKRKFDNVQEYQERKKQRLSKPI